MWNKQRHRIKVRTKLLSFFLSKSPLINHPNSFLTSQEKDSSEEYKNSGIYNSANIRSVKDGGGGAEEEAPPPSIPSTTQQSMLKKHQQSMIESPMFNTSNAARHLIPQKRRRPLQTSMQ